jgi:oligopeptide/dipeptide ABC transporter ATP-binding protein
VDRIRQERGTALILITHDISLVAENCDRIAIMYAGLVVEMATTAAIFARPMHPYTIGLQNAFPDVAGGERELVSIAGAPPDLVHAPGACSFAPRCPFAREKCAEPPPLVEAAAAHWVACHFPEEAESFRRAGREKQTWEAAVASWA